MLIDKLGKKAGEIPVRSRHCYRSANMLPKARPSFALCSTHWDAKSRKEVFMAIASVFADIAPVPCPTGAVPLRKVTP